MSPTTVDVIKRIERLPIDLESEFPGVPLKEIEQDVDREVHQLLTSAHFHDFVPVLVHKNVRRRLRSSQRAVEAPV
jgi:hypothetical protein